MKDKIGLIIGLIVAIIFIITIGIYTINTGMFNGTKFALALIALILVAGVFYVLWDRAKNLRKGLPAKDERLIIINYKAGYYGFIAAMFSTVLSPVVYDILFGREPEGHHIVTIIVLVSGGVFIASYLYLSKKGS
jgi:hypothetical protein